MVCKLLFFQPTFPTVDTDALRKPNRFILSNVGGNLNINMGVTIHFEGKLKSNKDFETVMKISTDFAEQNDLDYLIFEEQYKILQRVKNEKEWDYKGLTRGIKITPAINSDPLWIEFDKDYYIQEFCKTQFADSKVHIKIIELLKKIKPHFQELIVHDEGEYWDTGNTEILQKHLNNCFRAIEDAKSENPNLSGPYKVKGERIVDLLEND